MVEIINSFVQQIIGMGAAVMLPIVILLLGLFFGMKFGTALKSGLLVGIGFKGLCLVIDLLTNTIQPVIDYYEKMGGGYTTIDIGFAAVGGAAWTVPFAIFTIPVIIFINLLLIKFKLCKVMNVDIWNFVHFLIPGAMAYALFGSAALGFAVTVVLSVVALYFAQWAAPKWEEFFGLDGTTCTTLSFVALYYPIAVLLNKIYDKIPGLKDLDVDMSKIESKLGIFGDPVFIGVIVGAFLGVLTKQSISNILTISVGVAAVMLLLPRMVGVMMEGITPLGNAASKYMKKKVGEDADIYIGMDIALGLGDPCCITVTAITIPFVILMAFIVPNMTYFPLGLLTQVCYLAPMIVLACRGNVFRSLVSMILCMFVVVICANTFAPEATAMMNVTGVHVSGMITDGQFGWNPGNILVALASRLLH
ncbi:PTS transporter subunit IIC [Intestinibacter sp.]|uniref:PTS transporter subunit IIC n=1 Tax=Intestinibacter sp. TaxID=1965304 RepID=UPI003F17D3B3